MDIDHRKMTVQEIFDTPAVREIELQIILLLRKSEKNWRSGDADGIALTHLLKVRKNLLDSMFVMNDEYKALLTDFNDALTKQLLVMRQRTIQMRDAILQTNIDGDSMEAIGKCFFGYAYPKNHPVQTYRAKAMWCVLNGTWDNYIPLYSDGVDGGFRLYGNEEPPSEIKFLYYEEGLNNWNEGLDREMTKDMHLTRVFHNLYDHMEFSIFDLLWVRDFNIEVSVEIDSSTYPSGYECEDVDPHRDFSKILKNE